jgi:hypothetical protein
MGVHGADRPHSLVAVGELTTPQQRERVPQLLGRSSGRRQRSPAAPSGSARFLRPPGMSSEPDGSPSRWRRARSTVPAASTDGAVCPIFASHNHASRVAPIAGSERVTARLNIRCANCSKRYSSSLRVIAGCSMVRTRMGVLRSLVSHGRLLSGLASPWRAKRSQDRTDGIAMLTALQRPNLLILGQTLQSLMNRKTLVVTQSWHRIWHGRRKTGCDGRDPLRRGHNAL